MVFVFLCLLSRTCLLYGMMAFLALFVLHKPTLQIMLIMWKVRQSSEQTSIDLVNDS